MAKATKSDAAIIEASAGMLAVDVVEQPKKAKGKSKIAKQVAALDRKAAKKAPKASAKVKAAAKAEDDQKRSYGLDKAKVAEVLAEAKSAKKVPNPYRPSSSYAACINAIAACGKLGQFFDVKSICEQFAKVMPKDAFAAFKNRQPRENGLESWKDKVCQNCTTLTRQKDYGKPLKQVGFVVERQRSDEGEVSFALRSI